MSPECQARKQDQIAQDGIDLRKNHSLGREAKSTRAENYTPKSRRVVWISVLQLQAAL
jgi:hypothetical protein